MSILYPKFIPLAAICLTMACSQAGPQKNVVHYPLPEAGVVHENIPGFTCKDISYALYLPKTDGHAKNGLPVIILFDPHKSGLLPVKKYSGLALKYGYILVGSNDSKNGMPWNEVRGITSALLTEVLSVYPIDTARIYLAGFSGGSRVASNTAMENAKVKGVIGCGAGFNPGSAGGQVRFDFFGIAGTGDFNMQELLALEDPLSRAGNRHCIRTFPGPHEWPPVPVMEEAFQWLMLNAMRDGRIPKESNMVSGIMDGFRKNIDSLRAKNQLIAAGDACREAVRFAEGLGPAGGFRDMEDAIVKMPEYARQITYREALLRKEAEEQSLLQNSLLSTDPGWWKNRIAAMESRNMKGKNPEDTLMYSRLRAFLSLFCYAAVNQLMSQHEMAGAEKAVVIYEMADPPNTEPNYMRAILLADREDAPGAMAQLKVAVSKGFTDKQRMMQQPEFRQLQSLPAWFDLIKSMR